jgi:hypothetical protein
MPRSKTFFLALLILTVQPLGCGGGGGGSEILPPVPAPIPALTVSTVTLPPATVNISYSATLVAQGGKLPYTWAESSGGALPPGMSLSSAGVVSGTPMEMGSYGPFLFKVTDSAGTSASSPSLTLTIGGTGVAVCAPRGNESALNATTPFAFLVKGLDSNKALVAIAGSFTPDGNGQITASSVDYTGFSTGHKQLSVDLAASAYSLGSDSRGCLALTISPVPGPTLQPQQVSARGKRIPNESELPPATIAFSFVLGEQTDKGFQSGRIIQFDQTATGGGVSAGMMHVQTPSAFNLAALQPTYAFGVDGWDPLLRRLAIAGRFVNDSGSLSGGVGDVNDQGFVPPASGEVDNGSGILNSVIDQSTGRGTGFFSLPFGANSSVGLGFAFYVVNGSDFYMVSTDPPTDPVDANGLLSGQALATKGSFTPGSLKGSYLVAGLGFDASSFAGNDDGNVAEIGDVQVTTAGDVVGGNIYTNHTGSFASRAISSGTYVTQASGRTTIAAKGLGAPVVYLTGPSSDENIVGFFVGTDSFTTSGAVYSQTAVAPNFSAAALNSTFAMGSQEDVDGEGGSLDGVFTFDGVEKYSAVTDVASAKSAPTPGGSATGVFTVNADGSGILTFDGTSMTWLFLTNGTQIFAINKTGTGGGQIDPLLYVFTAKTRPD